jgi:hypothetical protein
VLSCTVRQAAIQDFRQRVHKETQQ